MAVSRAKRVEGETCNYALRFSPSERDLVHRLAEIRAKELREVAGIDVEVSVSTYLRWLIERDAEARGLGASKRKKKWANSRARARERSSPQLTSSRLRTSPR
jgi:hypothetical protein